MKKYYIGVMSGTSLDGIDLSLCHIGPKICKLVSSLEYSFDKKLKAQIISIISSQTIVKEIGEVDKKLGLLYAKSIQAFMKTNNLNKNDIEAIGLHGQTIWHQPNSKYPFSMQLGDPNSVVVQTGIKVVCDFRGMDVALGGEGAPFAPAFHHFLFSGVSKKRAVVNIGGMANITLFDKKLKGWDSGCGNILLDLNIQNSKGKRYDKNGRFAKSGKLDIKLLKSMLKDSYFKKNPPKSTGREYFNQQWLDKYTIGFNIKPKDLQRTLVELTAQTIADGIKNKNIDELIVCGGGVKNNFLMKRLSSLCSAKIISSDDIGVSSDFMESMAFAWLAYKRLNNEVVKLSSVTGAKKDTFLGAIYG